MEITGRLTKIGEVKQIGEALKPMVEFVLDIEGKYPNRLPFSTWGENVEIVNDIEIGTLVTVSYNLKGREGNGRHYVNLDAYKIQSDNE